MKIKKMTTREAMELRNDDVKVVVFIEKRSINGFDILRFKECKSMLNDGNEIYYITSDFIEQLRVESNPYQKGITILLPSST